MYHPPIPKPRPSTMSSQKLLFIVLFYKRKRTKPQMKGIYTYLIQIMSTHTPSQQFKFFDVLFLWNLDKIQGLTCSPLKTPGFRLCLLQEIFHFPLPPQTPSPVMLVLCLWWERKTSHHKIHLPTPTPDSLLYKSLNVLIPLPKGGISKNSHIPKKAGTLFYLPLCLQNLMPRSQNQSGQY